ncbi:MAG: DNA polymerase III subunit alpha [Bacteroidetes bacterium]|nr:DNA polymerase III subunit alpha [Bacteroidota bacterium]
MSDFVHLHNHSDYSLLDSCCKINDLIAGAQEHNLTALGLTDYGNLFGAAEFFSKAKSKNIKPIVGMEAYLAPDRLAKSKLIYHQVLFVRNAEGYANLMKLTSYGYLEGFYYKPRIDKNLLRKHAEGLIGTSSCLKGEIPQRLMHGQYDEARALALEYMEIFPENFYLEMQRHGLAVDQVVNDGLIRLSRELGLPILATNDVHYMQKNDAGAFDVLLCIQSGKSTTDVTRPKYPGDTFYFRSPSEMKELFKDVPSAIENTVALTEKCDFSMDFGQSRLPKFKLPEPFELEDKYLEHLAYIGIKRKMGDLTPDIKTRLDYELEMISRMGFPGYFLVVQDFINSAKGMGVSVGPGRGSAAGSLVSYAIGITDVDPIRYGLLFERFLNPDRISMPDIDIDFDDRNRGKVIEYVIDKYGASNVAQIITFGTMAARAVIRDVARALNVTLADADRIAKLIPRRILDDKGNATEVTIGKSIEVVPELKALAGHEDERMRLLLEHSEKLEGLIRQPGIHAAGVVITPEPLTDLVPVYKSAKDEISTQFDKDWVEKIGLLKMDFLGLTTLTILDDTLAYIEKGHAVRLDLHSIPLDDQKAFQLFWRGDTVGIFQFESQGMTEYMKKLKPTSIDDLIAMNALYRPGPMQYIDSYISRKHGREAVDCYHEDFESILKTTYGVIVYQEQVMQLAQKLAGFSLGKADLVRRIMAKKKPEELEKIRPDWINGALERGYARDLAEKLFEQLIPFSNYAFNKSHSAAYSILAYQTAYLKAHYPSEFMAAVLTSEMANTDRIAVLITACRDMGIEVLPPDVNESVAEFAVKEKSVRFGLGAIKNVGLGAIESIVNARQKFGKFRTIFDLCEHVDLRLVNKKVLESLVMSGACDSLEGHRGQLTATIEKAMQYGARLQAKEASDQVDIFGGIAVTDRNINSGIFALPDAPRWSQQEALSREKELLGFYVSGHPLEKYRFEIDAFSTYRMGEDVTVKEDAELRVGGMISNIKNIFDKKGNPMSFVTLEGFGGSIDVTVFSRILKEHAEKIKKDQIVMVVGRARYRNESLSVTCEQMMTIEEVFERFTRKVFVTLTDDQLGNGLLDALAETFRENQEWGKERGQTNSCEVELAVELSAKNAIAKYRINKFRVYPSNEFFQTLYRLLGRGRVTISTQ